MREGGRQGRNGAQTRGSRAGTLTMKLQLSDVSSWVFRIPVRRHKGNLLSTALLQGAEDGAGPWWRAGAWEVSQLI